MLLTSSYKKSRRLRLFALLAAAASLTLAAYKLYESYQKVHQYNQATAYYAASDYVLAEEHFDRASRNGWLQHHDAEIDQKLAELKPVTDIRSQLSALGGQIHDAGKDVKALVGLHNTYQDMKQKAATQGKDYGIIFGDLVKQFGVDDQLKNAFASLMKELTKELQAQIKKKAFSDDTLTAYLQIPADYFTDRNAEINASLEAYDTARLGALSSDTKQLLSEGARLQTLYKQYDLAAAWIAPQINQSVQDQLTAALKKNDLAAFIQIAKLYESNKAYAASGSKVLGLIQSTIDEQMKKASKFVSDKKYDQAIELYKQLSAYKSTEKQIQDTELTWAAEDPLHILQKALPGQKFDQVINGKDQLGAMLYAAGITSGKLVLVRMQKDMSIDKQEAPLGNDFRSKNLKVTTTPQKDSVLIVEGQSSTRPTRFVMFEVEPSGLAKRLDIEASGLKWETDGTLVVDNATGEGAGQQAYYNLQNGRYVFSGIKPDYVEIKLADLGKYKNVKVRFTCTLIAADGTNGVVMYNDSYILLSGNLPLRTGNAVITGTWVSNEDIKKGAQTISAYKVNVASVSQ